MSTRDTDRLISLNETATLLGLSYCTIRNYILRGQLPAVRLGPRRVFIKESALREFVDDEAKAIVPPRARR